MFRDALLRCAAQLSEVQVRQLEAHYDLLCRWNKVLNLTRIESPESVAPVTNLAPVLPLMTETDAQLQGLLSQ